MSQASEESREHWSGALAFVLAAVGSAVGLGNVWKFPYVAGNNGGGAFVMVYLGCIAAIGLPMLITEMVLGRRSAKGPVGAYGDLLDTDRGGTVLAVAGGLVALYGLFLLGTPTSVNVLVGLVCLILGSLMALFHWEFWGIFAIITGFLLLSFYSVVGGWTVGYIGKALVGLAVGIGRVHGKPLSPEQGRFEPAHQTRHEIVVGEHPLGDGR